MQDSESEGVAYTGHDEPACEFSNSTMQSHFDPTSLRAYMGLLR
jgi:hypothetical protein